MATLLGQLHNPPDMSTPPLGITSGKDTLSNLLKTKIFGRPPTDEDRPQPVVERAGSPTS